MSRLAGAARETLPKPENAFSQPNTTKLPARVGSSLLLGSLTIPGGRPAASQDTSLEPNTNTSPQNAAASTEQTLQVCPHTTIIITTTVHHHRCTSPTTGLATAAGFSVASASPKGFALPQSQELAGGRGGNVATPPPRGGDQLVSYGAGC